MMTITVWTFKRLTSMMVVALDDDSDYDDSDGGGEDHTSLNMMATFEMTMNLDLT